ncbi:hypothetical protein [Sporisorium scitamineum]|uniref:Rrp7 RRM-like N-terminal domain-containing protein n=1 Tax=Sporisorium scitamineum TaxID=49012 RepID=A0A0F7RWE7_9BASI|nr:hypothetical protein [Sporisorium scitamineum]
MGKRSSTSGGTIADDAKPKKATTSAIPLTDGFLAVPVTFADVKHWIYVRKHTASASAASTSKAVQALPAERTLFVANLPTDTTEEHVRDMFGWGG